MVRIGANGNLEALVGQLQISNADGDVSDVVVAVCHVGIVRLKDSTLEAVHGHVVLAGVEGTQAHVVPELAVVDAALDQSPVETHGYLGLVGVEVIRGDLGNGFYVVIVKVKDLFVNFEGLAWIVQKVMNSCYSNPDT